MRKMYLRDIPHLSYISSNQIEHRQIQEAARGKHKRLHVYRFSVLFLELFLLSFLGGFAFVHGRHRFHLVRGEGGGSKKVGLRVRELAKQVAGNMNRSTAQRKGSQIIPNEKSSSALFQFFRTVTHSQIPREHVTLHLTSGM